MAPVAAEARVGLLRYQCMQVNDRMQRQLDREIRTASRSNSRCTTPVPISRPTTPVPSQSQSQTSTSTDPSTDTAPPDTSGIEYAHDPLSLFNCSNKDKAQDNINRYHTRTAGVMMAIKPCGIITMFEEMFTGENITHMALALNAYYLMNETTITLRPRMYVYDRACQLEPAVAKLVEKQMLSPEIFGGCTNDGRIVEPPIYIVDAFHNQHGGKTGNGHKEPTCIDPDDPTTPNPDGCINHFNHKRVKAMFPPDSNTGKRRLPNTGICEQTFMWLGKYRYATKHFNRMHFWFFLHIIVHMHNVQTETRIRAKQNEATIKLKQTQTKIAQQLLGLPSI